MSNIKKEFLIFGSIGVVNTFVHSGIVIGFVEFLNQNPVFANIVAFLIANFFSYYLNSKYTFKVLPSWNRYIKFFIASLSAFGLTIFFALLAEYMQWHYLIGLFLVICVAPIITFIFQKKMVFNEKNGDI